MMIVVVVVVVVLVLLFLVLSCIEIYRGLNKHIESHLSAVI